MKKISLLLAILMLLLAFAACDPAGNGDGTSTGSETSTEAPEPPFEPTSADELMAKVEEVMDAIKSYKTQMTADFTFYIPAGDQSYETKGHVSVLELQTEVEGQKYFYLSTEMSSAVEALEMNATMKSLQAYYNGQMYLSNVSEQENVDQKLRGTVSVEDYEAFLKETAEGVLADEDLDMTECATKSFAKTAEGEWTLSFSGYTKKTVDALAKSMKFDTLPDGLEMEDMQIDILIDKDFRVKQMDVAFAFDAEEGENTPVMEMKAVYSDYGTATPITDTLDPEDYTEVEDILIVAKLSGMLDDLSEKESGKFDLDIDAKFRNKVASELDTVTYGLKNGAFYYSIVSITNQGRMLIQYENGVQSVTVAGGGQGSASISEEQAKGHIQTFLAYLRYDETTVTNVTKSEDGVYVLTCEKLDPEKYDFVFQGMGSYVCESASQEVTVTVENGKIKEITCDITALAARTNDNMRYTVTVTVKE